MRADNQETRQRKVLLRRLEDAFAELNHCSQDSIIEFTRKFSEYFRLFKEAYPDAIKEYNLRPYGPRF